MNPMTNVRNITKLSDRELKFGDGKTSWHDEYRDSAWLFVGGLPYDLTEGDVIAVFSQYGELVNINLIRDKGTGKSKGFAFICYENQRSTILAVDNFNGIKVLGRTIRVDHVKEYKVPKDSDKVDDLTRELWTEGCAPTSKFGTAAGAPGKDPGWDDGLLPEPPPQLTLPPPSSSGGGSGKPSTSSSSDKDKDRDRDRRGEKRKSHKDSKKSKKSKKSRSSDRNKKKKKKHHKKGSRRSSSSSSGSDSSDSD